MPIIKLECHRIKRVVILKCRAKIKVDDYFMCSNMLGLDMMANLRSCFFLLIFIDCINKEKTETKKLVESINKI